jgi:hypothetical protein
VVANLGALTQNTKLNIEAFDDIGVSVFSTTSTDTLLSTMDTNIFIGNQNFTPANTGMYYFNTWASSDSTLTDTITDASIVTDTVYGRDANNYQSYWRVGRSCGGMVLGAYYDIYATDDVTSISAYISPISVPGAKIYASLYEIDPLSSGQASKIWLTQSDDYIIQSSDLDNWVTLEIPGYTLNAGTSYMPAIGGYAHPLDTSAIGVSGQAWSSTCYIQDNGCNIGSQGYGDWYWISKVPMIRMNLGTPWITSIPENSFVEGIELYPNPTFDHINVELNNSTAEDISISVSNVLGQEVYSIEKLALKNSKEIFDFSTFGKGVYFLEIESKKGRFLEKVVVE